MYRACLAELIGTFALVLAGCGAIVIDAQSGGTITHIGVALTFGLIVMTMIHTIGDVSGAHINPAVTIGFCLARRLSWAKAPGYIAAQCLGAVAAAGLLRVMFAEHGTLGATLPAGSAMQSFLLEVVLSGMLMLVILVVATGPREQGMMAGVAVGGMVGLNALWAGPISGASMNPARSLGPAVVSGHLSELWIYLIAPVVGAAVAVGLCKLIHRPGECCLPASDPA